MCFALALLLREEATVEKRTNLRDTQMTTILPVRSQPKLKIHTATAAPAQTLLAHPNEFFAADVQAELAQSDHEAWTAVCAILITIVSLGLVIGIGSVLLTL